MIKLSEIRAVFMGSPGFALPILQVLASTVSVVGVVTQPDRPAGRGRMLTPPPVKNLAQYLNIPIIQPVRLKEPATLEQLHTWEPDLILVAAFGQILRAEVLDLPRHGCLNVHASLLPRWRGAAPIQAAILAGDSQTGATIIRMDPGIDTGPVLSQRSISILPDDTSGSLNDRLSKLGAQLLIDVLPGYLQGNLIPQAQPEIGATYAPLIHKEEGKLDFNHPARELVRRVLAFNPWPGAFTVWNDQILKIHRAHTAYGSILSPGQRLVHAALPAIASADGLLILDEVQPAGKKSMAGTIFLQGARNWEG